MPKISILVVDDHMIVREGLKAALSAEQDMEVVGEAEDGKQAISVAKQTSPDVVIMDVAMPGMNGAAATRQILKAVPNTKVLVVSSYSDELCVAELMEAGALGYLMKQSAANELARAVREVRRGHYFFSQALAQRIRHAGQGGIAPELSPREMQVLKLIAAGSANKQVAQELGISVKTVEKHRQSLMNKLNIHEVAGLTRYAIGKGMVEAKVQTGN